MMLYFSQSAMPKNDIRDVKSVFNQLNIPFIFHGANKLGILTAGGHP